jgi:hypothetical protein
VSGFSKGFLLGAVIGIAAYHMYSSRAQTG